MGTTHSTGRYHCSWSACSRLYVRTAPGHTYCGQPDCPATAIAPAHAGPSRAELLEMGTARRTFAELTAYELQRFARYDAPYFLAHPAGDSTPVAYWSIDTARDHGIRMSGIGSNVEELWARQADGTYMVLELLDRTNGGHKPTGWHYLVGPPIPTGWYSELPPVAGCPGCADGPCDGQGRMAGGRRCRWCQEAGSCPSQQLEARMIDDTNAAHAAGEHPAWRPGCELCEQAARRSPEPAGGHFDIRLICPATGQLEATEDNGHSLAAAREHLTRLADDRSRYAIVFCDRPGTDPVHDVDVAYHRHVTEHTPGGRPGPLERWVGTPIPFAWDAPADVDGPGHLCPSDPDAPCPVAAHNRQADASYWAEQLHRAHADGLHGAAPDASCEACRAHPAAPADVDVRELPGGGLIFTPDWTA